MEQLILRKNKGYVTLFIVVVILIIFTILGSVLFLNFTSISRVSEVDEYRIQAFYLAEAGIKDMIRAFKNSQTIPPDYVTKTVDFSNWQGKYEVKRDNNKIVSIGVVPVGKPNQVQKEIYCEFDLLNYKITYWEDVTNEYSKW